MAPVFLGPEWGVCSFVSLIFRATLRPSQCGNQSIPLGRVREVYFIPRKYHCGAAPSLGC